MADKPISEYSVTGHTTKFSCCRSTGMSTEIAGMTIMLVLGGRTPLVRATISYPIKSVGSTLKCVIPTYGPWKEKTLETAFQTITVVQ